ncbi:hypothetical protein WJ23_19975 [Burkholderia lata]|nr:hypothetical protein WJ23_19975 [Burkholderia lata]
MRVMVLETTANCTEARFSGTGPRENLQAIDRERRIGLAGFRMMMASPCTAPPSASIAFDVMSVKS